MLPKNIKRTLSSLFRNKSSNFEYTDLYDSPVSEFDDKMAHSAADSMKVYKDMKVNEIYDYTKGTFIECNAAYEGGRHTTEKHKKLLQDHGWLDNGRKTVIMDENPSDDFKLKIENPRND